jgi:hypothetical protein
MYVRRYCGGTGPAWCNAYAKGCAEAPGIQHDVISEKAARELGWTPRRRTQSRNGPFGIKEFEFNILIPNSRTWTPPS